MKEEIADYKAQNPRFLFLRYCCEESFSSVIARSEIPYLHFGTGSAISVNSLCHCEESLPFVVARPFPLSLRGVRFLAYARNRLRNLGQLPLALRGLFPLSLRGARFLAYARNRLRNLFPLCHCESRFIGTKQSGGNEIATHPAGAGNNIT